MAKKQTPRIEDGKQIISYRCPECPNDEFRILETVIKAGIRAGRYRAECTVCGHRDLVVSKTPRSEESSRPDRRNISGVKINGIYKEDYIELPKPEDDSL